MDFLNSAITTVNRCADQMERVAEMDARYWKELEVGQDSEEAEASGYLEGYHDCLRAVQRLLVHRDPQLLTDYVSSAAAAADEQELELEGEDAEMGPLTQAVINIQSAKRVISPIWEDMSKFGHSGADDVAGAIADLQQAVRYLTGEEEPS